MTAFSTTQAILSEGESECIIKNVWQCLCTTRGGIIRLHAHPLLTSPVSKLRKTDNLLGGGGGVKGVGEEPNRTTARKPGPL
jgi:hypothetical protein